MENKKKWMPVGLVTSHTGTEDSNGAVIVLSTHWEAARVLLELLTITPQSHKVF